LAALLRLVGAARHRRGRGLTPAACGGEPVEQLGVGAEASAAASGFLGGVVVAAQPYRCAAVGKLGERRHLLLAKRAALQDERAARGRREAGEGRRLDGGEPPLRLDVEANRLDDAGGKESLEQGGGTLGVVVTGLLGSTQRGCSARGDCRSDQPAEVVQQAGGDELGRVTGVCRQLSALQGMLEHRHRLAEIGSRASTLEQPEHVAAEPALRSPLARPRHCRCPRRRRRASGVLRLFWQFPCLIRGAEGGHHRPP
jgi:hypothetical protein